MGVVITRWTDGFTQHSRQWLCFHWSKSNISFVSLLSCTWCSRNFWIRVQTWAWVLLPLGVVYVAKSSFYDGIKAIQKIKTVSAVIPSDLQAGLCMYKGLDCVWESSLLLTRLHRPRRKGETSLSPPLSLPLSLSFGFFHFPIPQSLANQQSDYPYN